MKPPHITLIPDGLTAPLCSHGMVPQGLCSRCPSAASLLPQCPPAPCLSPAVGLQGAFLTSVSNVFQSFSVLSPECLALSGDVPPSPQHGAPCLLPTAHLDPAHSKCGLLAGHGLWGQTSIDLNPAIAFHCVAADES